MNNRAPEPASGGLNPREILMILFRNKWKIILFALLGVGAAAGVWLKVEPPYKSTAKVLVKYTIDTPVMLGPEGYEVNSADPRGANVMNTEIAILNSWDLANEVVAALGPDMILSESEGTNQPVRAAIQVKKNLEISAGRNGNVIEISYQNDRPGVTVPILSEILDRYRKNHVQVHRSAASSDELLREMEMVESKMKAAQTKLTALKKDLQITTTLVEARTQLHEQVGELKTLITEAKADLAEHEAQLSEAERETLAGVDSDQPVTVLPQVPLGILSDYANLHARLAEFRKRELDLIGQFTPQNPSVRQVQENISAIESQMRGMETNHPGLSIAQQSNVASNGNQIVGDNANLTVQVIATRARLIMLNEDLATNEFQLNRIFDSETTMTELEREFELAKGSYVTISSKMEISRFDEALDPSKIPNINILQTPSLPFQDTSKRLKMAGGAFVVFFALGLGLAFARELVFDQSIHSPLDIESKLQLPLFMSIPLLSDRQPVKLLANGPHDSERADGALAPACRMPWEMSHFIRPYCEALRDRLIMYFQLKNLHRKPKLVAVTSCNEGAGATTLAAGLAASLSETGDGKVLLVDMNINRPEMHPFFRGNLASSLTVLLQSEIQSGHGEKENLYLATATATERNGNVTTLVPSRFYELLPKLKSSSFDYIIFDMPPIKQTSSTVPLSGLMDKVLLVIEPGKTNRDLIKRAVGLMHEQHADVAGVVNRMPKSAMKWLEPNLV